MSAAIFKRGGAEPGGLCWREMEESSFLTGQILLALPGIGDPRFERAVIAMCAHDEQGALGVGIGHEIDGLSLHDLLGQFEIDP